MKPETPEADIADAAARLACYDAGVGRNTPTEPEPAPLTEDVGEEQLDPALRPEREPENFQGRVTKCQQDASNKWLFYFDNGQVWKQRSGNRLRFRDCDFGVTITKDSFGYKMQIDGETRKIRIGRIR